MKKTIALLLALVMAFGLCACGSTGESGASVGTANTGDYDAFAAEYGEVGGLYKSIIMATRQDLQNLEPTAGTGAPKESFYWNIYECLFEFDEDLNLYSDLAKYYTPAEDGSYWDMTLYETIYDQAGNHITAEDCVSSFDWVVNAGEALKFENVKSWEAVDEYTFRIYWNHKPAASDEYEFPLCRTYIFDSSYSGYDFAVSPVGTGNYRVAEFVTGNHLTIWADKNYWADNTDEDVSNRLNLHKATVQMITFSVITESASAEIALEEGTVDFCDYITQSASIQKFKDEYSDKYIVDDTKMSTSFFFLEPSMDSASILSSDENLRLAIYYGLSNDMIAALMGSNYEAMSSLGHIGQSDFNVAWNDEVTYVNTYDVELAKEYLAKSNYANQDLVICCKTGETEKNAAQSIMAQLMSIGITCHLNCVDTSLFTDETSDPANWDLIVFEMGGANLVSALGLPLGQPNTAEGGTAGIDGWSLNFIRDNELYQLLQDAKADETHDDEHVKALIDYALDHQYIYPIAHPVSCYIYSKEFSDIYYRESSVTPAACTYAGQTKLEETAVTVNYVEEVIAYDAALAGTYTYEEPPKFGDGMNELTLTLNADGTYRLDMVNGVGESVYTEGTWSSEGSVAYLSASPVMGDMNRMLVDWVDDFENPDPTLTLNADGTFTPVVPVDLTAYAGDYTFSERDFEGYFGNQDCDYVLTLNEDGTYVLACNNSVGEDIWTEGTFSVNADGSVKLSESPVYGDMNRMFNSGWIEDYENPAPSMFVNEDGTFTPVGVETEAAEEAAEEAPAEEAAAEEAPAEEAASEDDGGFSMLLGYLESNFHEFKYVDEAMGDPITWYLFFNDEEGTFVLVVNNPFMGILRYDGTIDSEDGPAKYCTVTKNEPEDAVHFPDFFDGDSIVFKIISGEEFEFATFA